MSESGIEKPDQQLMSNLKGDNDTIMCVTLDMLINSISFQNSFLDLQDRINEAKQAFTDEF